LTALVPASTVMADAGDFSGSEPRYNDKTENRSAS
jgi:hypothetical protein